LLLTLLGWLIPVSITEAEKQSPAPPLIFNTNINNVPQPTHRVEVAVHTKEAPRLPSKPKAVKAVAPKPVPNTPVQASHNGRSYTVSEVIELIKGYSKSYGISADIPLRIAKCESGYNSLAKNKTSSASGVFQYLASTWRGTDQGKAGLSVFDADANVKAAVSYIAIHKATSPWNASKACWG
jgi:hypothetical protein